MRVLVTGGAGFIGSHLVEQLLALGNRVRVMDNLSTGKRENLPRNHPALEFIGGDIRDRRTVTNCMRQVDAVFHLAAIASVQATMDDPIGAHETNLDGTLYLLDAAREAGVRRFIYASSAAVYGDAVTPPASEEAPPRPLSPYAIDKLGGEYYLEHYHRKYGLNGTSFRFFNIYGPRQDPGSPYSGVISLFLDRLQRDEPLTVYGDGKQTRDFVYVGDLAALLTKALYQDGLAGQVFNVGTGVESSLLELIGELEGLSGRLFTVEHAEARLGDIRRSRADITQLRRRLGFVPATPLRVGLASLVTPLEERRAALA
jgi:UDP-glucose 4-epimerase